jgi:hypothetical protein
MVNHCNSAPYSVYWAIEEHPLEVSVVVTDARTDDNTQDAVTPLMLWGYGVKGGREREGERVSE